MYVCMYVCMYVHIYIYVHATYIDMHFSGLRASERGAEGGGHPRAAGDAGDAAGPAPRGRFWRALGVGGMGVGVRGLGGAGGG